MKNFSTKNFQILYNFVSGILLLLFLLIFMGVKIPGIDKVLLSRADYENYLQVTDLLSLKSKIDEQYYSDVDNNLLQEGAIRGMFLSLPDGYSRYLSKEELAQRNLRNKGESIGIGIEIQEINRQYVIVNVLENMPAQRAGLQKGDIIVSVNGIEMNVENYSQILNAIRENKKEFFVFGNLTSIQMIIQRNGESLELIVERELSVESTVEYHIEDKIAIVRISRFTASTYDEFDNALKEILSTDANGMLLDLRGNPGGLVDEATNIAGTFLGKEKIIYYTVNNSEGSKAHYSKIAQKIFLPTVVVMDSKTASASEILIGALKDHNAATIVGNTSFGKGIIQTTFTRIKGDGYQITTSEYLTPNEEKIHKKGINPDIEIDVFLTEDETENFSDAQEDIAILKAKELLLK